MSDQIIPITRPSGSPPVLPTQPPTKTDPKFPSEVIHLPSKGWFYSPDNPLSEGTLELKMMTAREEDILTSRNLIQKNIVLDKLLESVVINKAINLDEMLICDRNAAFFAIRRLAYGDEYNARVTCGRCGKENDVVIDLAKMDNRPFEFEKYPRGENNFTFKLPTSGVTITFKLLTKKDENSIEQQLAGHIVTSIDGNTEKNTVRKFVNDQLLSKDSLALRRYIRETMPDIDATFDFSCSECGLQRKEETPMGVSFFWPNG
jgi:hypothetical protein